MRIRALLFIPALAAAALAIGAGSASAATLFLTNNHAGGRVAIGTTADATSVAPLDLTTTTGALFNRCTDISLNVRVVENTVARSTLEVYSSQFGVCHPFGANGTHAPPWRLTVTGAGTMIGDRTSFAATLHNFAFDFAIPMVTTPFTGNLEGLTVTQTTTATNEICIDANRVPGVVNPQLGTVNIDAKFCLTGTAANWSLT